jgi:hypothetical protein
MITQNTLLHKAYQSIDKTNSESKASKASKCIVVINHLQILNP